MGKGANKRFSREAFIYQAAEDCYYCPQGRKLQRVSQEKRCDKNGEEQLRWRYRPSDCSSCSLRDRCLKGAAKHRTIIRNVYQDCRDRLAMQMSDPTFQKLYKSRAPVVEGTFGYIKHVMGIRRFYRRGMQAVQNEWQWTCIAFNVGKILRLRLSNGITGSSGGSFSRGNLSSSEEKCFLINISLLYHFLFEIWIVFLRQRTARPRINKLAV